MAPPKETPGKGGYGVVMEWVGKPHKKELMKVDLLPIIEWSYWQ
jgi:hypothetical protein